MCRVYAETVSLFVEPPNKLRFSGDWRKAVVVSEEKSGMGMRMSHRGLASCYEFGVLVEVQIGALCGGYQDQIC